MRRFRFRVLAACGALVAGMAATSASWATLPYVPVVPGGPVLGPGVAPPRIVLGKEYSHDMDHMITAVGTAPSPEQVVTWDGSGGVANGLNYVGTRTTFTILSQVDAIANHGDALYVPLREDVAHIIYSIDDAATAFIPGLGHVPVKVPSAGPITIPDAIKAGVNIIGGAGEISYELGVAGAAAGNLPNTHGIWATQAQINAMPFPDDIDGLEVWGPEPGPVPPGGTASPLGDSDKYSLDVDTLSAGLPGGAVSVWSLSGSPYILHSTIVAAVTTLLGDIPTPVDANINLDALMVRDVAGDIDDFGRAPDGALDEIIFSIRQIPNPADATGYYATGSELFVLTAAGGPASVSFLHHGGHLWDKAYALANMTSLLPDATGQMVRAQLDLNALEAIPEAVPEPACAGMALFAVAGLMVRRRRRDA
jgi:MYXO-CTERM domain-containing protein